MADFKPDVHFGYTARSALKLYRGPDAIRTEKILAVIKELNETLALSNEPGLLAPTSLDTLCGALDVECAWLQTVDGESLRLAAGQGLTPALEAALKSFGHRHPLRQRVLGWGETVAFPDLAARAVAAPAAFRQAGFNWLVAAPLMTHRAGGILGVASRQRKMYDRDLPLLVGVLGGMVGGALQKARLTAPVTEVKEPPPCESIPVPPPPPSLPPREDTFFQRHKRRMTLFRHAHGEAQL